MKSAGVEGVVATEALQLVRRDRGKLKLVLGLYALSFKGGEMGKTTRAAYFFARHLDDLLDGDRHDVEHPVEYARSLQEQITEDKFDSSMKIGRLAQFAIPRLERVARPTDNPRGELVGLIDALVFDYERRQERRELSEQELRTYYQDVLNPGFNVMLTGFGSEVRTCDIPEYSPNLGRLYSVRDLAKDWKSGVINVPSETLEAGQLSGQDSFDDIAESETIDGWLNREVHEASVGMRNVQRTIGRIAEPLPIRVLDGFANSAIESVAA